MNNDNHILASIASLVGVLIAKGIMTQAEWDEVFATMRAECDQQMAAAKAKAMQENPAFAFMDSLMSKSLSEHP